MVRADLREEGDGALGDTNAAEGNNVGRADTREYHHYIDTRSEMIKTLYLHNSLPMLLAFVGPWVAAFGGAGACLRAGYCATLALTED